MPLTTPREKTVAAAALIRAGLVDDADAGVLIIDQHTRDRQDVNELVLAVTALSVRVLLAANGADVARALRVIEQWMERAAQHGDAGETS